MPNYISKYQMGFQYTEINGVLIDDKDYQDDVVNWVNNRCNEMRANIKDMMPYQKRELRGSVNYRLIKKGGYITNASFEFYRSGIFDGEMQQHRQIPEPA